VSKQLIIFDMDGTLVNSAVTIANAINHVRQNLGFEPMSYEYILKRVNDHTINPARTFYHTDRFEPEHEKWFSEYYTQNHTTQLVLYDGIKALLEGLKAQQYALAVATNAYRISTLESLTHLGIDHLFDAIACYDDVPQGKPHPDMLHKILDELKISANEAIFVGDGPRDLLASQRAGIEYIMVDWGFTAHTNAVQTVSQLEEKLSQSVV
jgi:phosphoglycolate phosphatase